MGYSDITDLLFLIPLAVVGLFSSYADIKRGKIPNKWLSFCFIYILFLYTFLFFYALSLGRLGVGNKEYLYNIFKLLTNGFTAFLSGYVLWHFNRWSAADAKLFAIYSFLIPLNFYSKSYLSIFPSFNLLVNLFIPLLLILILKAGFSLIRKGLDLTHKIRNFHLSDKKNILIGLTSLFWKLLGYVFAFIVLRSLFYFMGREILDKISSNHFLIFASSFLIMGRLNKLRQKIKWLNFIIYGVILAYGGFLIFNNQVQFLRDIFKNAVIFMASIGLIRQLLNFYIGEQGIKKIEIENISKRAIPIGWLPFAPFLFLSAIISISTQSSFFPYITRVLLWLRNLL